MSNREAKRAEATIFVDEVNARTVCALCGAQPIEWHREEHEEKPNSRVSSLRTQGASIERIQREMDLCEPVCRSCHMKLDGRGAALHSNQPFQAGVVYVGPLPCSCCGRERKPLRRGMCSSCYNHRTGLRVKVTPGCCDPHHKETPR